MNTSNSIPMLYRLIFILGSLYLFFLSHRIFISEGYKKYSERYRMIVGRTELIRATGLLFMGIASSMASLFMVIGVFLVGSSFLLLTEVGVYRSSEEANFLRNSNDLKYWILKHPNISRIMCFLIFLILLSFVLTMLSL